MGKSNAGWLARGVSALAGLLVCAALPAAEPFGPAPAQGWGAYPGRGYPGLYAGGWTGPARRWMPWPGGPAHRPDAHPGAWSGWTGAGGGAAAPWIGGGRVPQAAIPEWAELPPEPGTAEPWAVEPRWGEGWPAVRPAPWAGPGRAGLSSSGLPEGPRPGQGLPGPEPGEGWPTPPPGVAEPAAGSSAPGLPAAPEAAPSPPPPPVEAVAPGPAPPDVEATAPSPLPLRSTGALPPEPPPPTGPPAAWTPPPLPETAAPVPAAAVETGAPRAPEAAASAAPARAAAEAAPPVAAAPVDGSAHSSGQRPGLIERWMMPLRPLF